MDGTQAAGSAYVRIPDLIDGYRSFNVLGMGQEERGLLYHKPFRSNLTNFINENEEIKAAINQSEQKQIDSAADEVGWRSGSISPAAWLTSRDILFPCPINFLSPQGSCGRCRASSNPGQRST
jgi:hypothetical protein